MRKISVYSFLPTKKFVEYSEHPKLCEYVSIKKCVCVCVTECLYSNKQVDFLYCLWTTDTLPTFYLPTSLFKCYFQLVWRALTHRVSSKLHLTYPVRIFQKINIRRVAEQCNIYHSLKMRHYLLIIWILHYLIFIDVSFVDLMI